MASFGAAVLVTLAIIGQTLGREEPLASQKIINCYWEGFSENSPGNNRFLLSDLDPHLCTHVTYAAVGFDAKSWKVISSPKELDVVNGTYKRFNELKLKNPNLKTLICLSGGGESYKQLVADPVKRATFIGSVVNLLNKYNFDGFDFDWEYPGDSNKDNFMTLLKELRSAFDENKDRRLLLSAAVGHNPETIVGNYDPKKLSEYLDFINVMTYDYHGYSEKHPYTHLNAPLYSLPKDESPNQNAAFALEYFAKQEGVDKAKLLMGIPAYGRGFTLANSDEHGIFAPAVGHIGAALNISDPRHYGYWAFNEYCDRMRTESNEWTLYRNSRTVAPYVVNGLSWLGFDDALCARIKAEYVRDMGFGGVMIWTINQDDFRGFCGEKFGLTRAMARAFNE